MRVSLTWQHVDPRHNPEGLRETAFFRPRYAAARGHIAMTTKAPPLQYEVASDAELEAYLSEPGLKGETLSGTARFSKSAFVDFVVTCSAASLRLPFGSDNMTAAL